VQELGAVTGDEENQAVLESQSIQSEGVISKWKANPFLLASRLESSL